MFVVCEMGVKNRFRNHLCRNLFIYSDILTCDKTELYQNMDIFCKITLLLLKKYERNRNMYNMVFLKRMLLNAIEENFIFFMKS